MHSNVDGQMDKLHILGLGSIGTFVAHSLADVPRPFRPSITLLLHRPQLMEQYVANGCGINLRTPQGDCIRRSGFHLEVLDSRGWHSRRLHGKESIDPESSQGLIENLIVSVKAVQTVDALRPLQARLNSNSNILFLQNGSGAVEQVNQQLFPDPKKRPKYMVGVITHGVTLDSRFNIIHTGCGATSLGSLPHFNVDRDIARQGPPNRVILKILPLAPALNAVTYPPEEILQIQLEKLATNAFCNPLCALNDAKNGFLQTIPDIRRALLTEVSSVIQSLPELSNIPGVADRFSVDRLEQTVNDTILKTAQATCSMVVDLRCGQETEIQYINGFWVCRGKELGIPTPINDDLLRQILEKQC